MPNNCRGCRIDKEDRDMKGKERKATHYRFRRDLQSRNCLHLWRFSFWLFLIAFLNVAGCDNLLTKPPPEGDDFVTPFDGMSFDLNRTFVLGDEAFEKVFTVEEGLGPILTTPVAKVVTLQMAVGPQIRHSFDLA